MPFREGHFLRLGGSIFNIKHVDVGTNRLEVEHSSSGVRKDMELTDVFAQLRSGTAHLVDKDGVVMDFSEMSEDVLTLSEPKQALFHLRVRIVKKLHVLGIVGPANKQLIAAVASANKENATNFKPSTAYQWLQTYRTEGTFRSLARPRSLVYLSRKAKSTKSSTDEGADHVAAEGDALGTAVPARMHRVTRKALDAVLQEETARLDQRLKDQGRKISVHGRTGLSLRAIAQIARGRVETLHRTEHADINSKLASMGLAQVSLPPLPPGPSNRTVQLEVYRKDSRWTKLAAIYGPHVTKRRLGPHGANFKLTRICERWETDLFIADILISIYYQGVLVPVGVPYLLVMIDCYSGAVVGIIIEFRPPNYETFLALCKQSFTPKAWLFEAFPGIKNHIEIFGAPEVIGYDNAGMFSKQEQVDAAEAVMNIILDPATAYTPNDKPFIESFGSVMNRTLLRHQPGNKKSIAEARALEYDAWQQPPMPMEVFATKLWEWVWNVFHELPMDDRHGWSRRQTWTHSMQTLAQSDDPAALFPLDGQMLDIEIAKRHRLAYTDEGFTMDNRHYRSIEMHSLAMRFPAKFKFDVREDLSSPHHVFAVVKEYDRVVKVSIASELPQHLTSNAFRSLQDAKAAMADPNLAQLAASLEASEAGWRPPRGARHIPNSREGLAVLLSRFPEVAQSLVNAQAGTSSGSPRSEKASTGALTDAFSKFFDQAPRDDG